VKTSHLLFSVTGVLALSALASIAARVQRRQDEHFNLGQGGVYLVA